VRGVGFRTSLETDPSSGVSNRSRRLGGVPGVCFAWHRVTGYHVELIEDLRHVNLNGYRVELIERRLVSKQLCAFSTASN
jgi:hypothetical protein